VITASKRPDTGEWSEILRIVAAWASVANHGKIYFILALFLFLPYPCSANDERFGQAEKAIVSGEIHRPQEMGKRNMNTAGQIAVTLAALIGFGRLFLAEEGDSHRLSGVLILASLVGKIALSI
jgi:hypothetical protein